MKNYILVLFTLLISLNSCKKYDEGPMLSLSSKESRLCQKWKCTELYYSNGTLATQTGWWVSLEYKKNGKVLTASNLGQSNYEYDWKFNNDKTIIIGGVGNISADQFLIKRLTNKDLWLQAQHTNPQQDGYLYKFSTK
jgi:hypothetical protein